MNTIIEYIYNYGVEQPDKLAVIDTDKELTYKEYWNKILTTMAFIMKCGGCKGDKIIIKNSQNVEFLVILHAMNLLGAVAVPVEKSVNLPRVLELIEATDTKLFLGDMEVPGIDCYTIEDAYAYDESPSSYTFPQPEDESLILFTTGTTGKSKGILLQHMAELAVGRNIVQGIQMDKDNIELIPMPMNHSFGLRRYYGNIVNGSTTIIMDGVFFVKPIFEMLKKYSVTAVAVTPGALSILLKLTKDKLSEYKEQLHYFQFGGSPIPEGDKVRICELLPKSHMFNIYGTTEVGIACVLDFNSAENEHSSIGYPTPGTTFKIIDEAGDEKLDATRENPGFITYTSGTRMKCYYNEPDLTKNTLVEGYLQSSDLGFRDEKGRIYMLGRGDDVIISGGNKISPIEVEEVAMEVVGIDECICKGRKDPLIGAVPVMYVVVNEEFSQERLQEHLLNHLEDFKRPRAIVIIDEVPKTYNGKIDRKVEIEA